ncbi:hypothetical protein [Kiloniella litopenaei]|uniref:hypothetical protein n=1 Tax=Kiloniella litopenaei TaxID=1549748 RepID=UPI003BA88DA1
MGDHLFNLESYTTLLKAFLKTEYEFVDYKEVCANRRHIVLRHDVDMDIAAALMIAKIENDLEISSTYFFLIRSNLYNPMTQENTASIKEILRLGHRVELHLDTTLYGDALEDIEAGAEYECNVLSKITGNEVSFISFHRPAKKFLNQNYLLAGRDHAYQSKYFSDIGYCSDSRGEWRFGHPLEHDSFINRTAFQLLTHPIWWVYKGTTAQEKLNNYVEDKTQAFQRSLADNCQTYRL